MCWYYLMSKVQFQIGQKKKDYIFYTLEVNWFMSIRALFILTP